MDIDPRKEDRVIRVQFKKCLLCTFYQKEFILSSVRDVIRYARKFDQRQTKHVCYRIFGLISELMIKHDLILAFISRKSMG